jgi:hypothetical protein
MVMSLCSRVSLAAGDTTYDGSSSELPGVCGAVVPELCNSGGPTGLVV